MIKYKSIKCQSPYCRNTVRIRADEESLSFCSTCKSQYSRSVLNIQYKFSLPIKDVLTSLMDTYHFKSLEAMAKFLGVPRKILYEWINEYIGIDSWTRFKQKYSCKSECVFINCDKLIKNQLLKNKFYKYWIINHIKKKCNVCVCMPSKFDKTASKDNSSYILVKLRNTEKIPEIQKLIVESGSYRKRKNN
mgnify:CR=1 FL=1